MIVEVMLASKISHYLFGCVELSPMRREIRVVNDVILCRYITSFNGRDMAGETMGGRAGVIFGRAFVFRGCQGRPANSRPIKTTGVDTSEVNF